MFRTPFPDPAFAFQQPCSHLAALLGQPAGLVPSLHLCVLLPPRGNMIQEIQLLDFTTEPVHSELQRRKSFRLDHSFSM